MDATEALASHYARPGVVQVKILWMPKVMLVRPGATDWEDIELLGADGRSQVQLLYTTFATSTLLLKFVKEAQLVDSMTDHEARDLAEELAEVIQGDYVEQIANAIKLGLARYAEAPDA